MHSRARWHRYLISNYESLAPLLNDLQKLHLRLEFASIYRYSDLSKFQFGTLPGIVGFLYYSGSHLIVFLGMLIMVILLVFVEEVIMKLTKNPVLCSLLAFSLANMVAQFGVCPRGMIPYLSMVLIAVVFIAFIQRVERNKLLVCNEYNC